MNRHRSHTLLKLPLRARALRLAAGGALALALGTAAQAQSPGQAVAPAPDSANLAELARAFVEPSLAAALSQAGASALRPEIIMGSLDARLRLAPCARVEAHLPPGTRLWGRSRIGLRCVEGATRWNVFLPVTVKAWGPAWVLNRAVPAGTPLTQEDAEMAEVDWAEHAAHVLAAPSLWVGQQAAYTLVAGQALRQHMVRPPQAFAAGSQVRVVQTGSGFQVVVTGEALAAGLVGQATRVRLPGGRVVSGLVRDGQTVELVL
ncbi:MAG: flagellar basal body P-ring formation chaperone FlgA [Hydrogenophaga sp.]|nr:flagellar basal body P-ring formation chaperone FlgA [Hydrogenophaga sp.]